MQPIRVSNSKDRFEQNGKPWFYLADTIWSAFSNITEAEWKEYLTFRRLQGFNALQINILTVWDAGASDLNLYPFDRNDNGHFQFDRINKVYFERAASMLKTATNMRFVPSLTLLWGNYVPGTWMSEKYPQYIMPFSAMEKYAEYTIKLFAPYKPIYMASGDTDFQTPEAVKYYRRAMELIRQHSPESPITMHMGPGSDVPDELLQSSLLDFYMYQSGHRFDGARNPYLLAEKFCAKSVKRPVVNGEPCYEGHHFGDDHGRCSQYTVRKALWQSLLSGAKAGVTYGAQGLWGWYTEGKDFLNEPFGGRPLPWRRALQFPGGWDAGYARHVYETYGLHNLDPQPIVRNKTSEIRASVSPDHSQFAAYSPFNTQLDFALDLSEYEIVCIELENRRVIRPVVECGKEASVIRHIDFNSDMLVIGQR